MKLLITKEKDSDKEEVSTLQVLPVHGSELAYRVSGEGPPVLLIHGIAGALEVWDDVQDFLATTHRVVSYDRRGHGRSPNGISDVRVHAKDAAGLIKHVVGEQVIAVGWSAGAGVTMELIRSHAEQVRAGVLIEPTIHLPRHATSSALRLALSTKLYFLLGRDRVATENMARWALARRSGGNGWDELDRHQRNYFLGDTEGFRTEFKLRERHPIAGDHISVEEIAAWSVPMTYLIGEDSAPWATAIHHALTDAAPQIRTVRVPGACHAMPLQEPEAVAEAVRSAVPN